MLRVVRVLGFIVLVLVILVGLVVGGSAVISPPGAGKSIAQNLSIPYPAVIAHRGASSLAPEATAPAYELARDMGADYLEIDVQRTADDVLIVFHDETLDRTTNIATVFPGREDDHINTFTYDELLELDTGSWFNKAYPDRAQPAYEGLTILTLEEVITIAEEGNNNPGLYLETKDAPLYPGIEVQILQHLDRRGWVQDPPALQTPDLEKNQQLGAPCINTAATPARVIFQSFHPESIIRFKNLAPHIPRILLISEDMEEEYSWESLLDVAETSADGVGPVGYLAWPWNVGSAHRKGLLVHPYTINEEWQMRLLSFFGADGLFTDNSELAIEVLDRGGPVDLEALLAKNSY